MKDKTKLFFLTLGGFFASILPLVAVVAWNWQSYARTVPEAVKLGVGGMIAAVLILLKVLGVLKIPGRVSVVALVMLLSYLLRSLLDDLTLLCFAYLLGEALDALLFARPAKRLREKLQMEKQAKVTADAVGDAIKSYIGNGRV